MAGRSISPFTGPKPVGSRPLAMTRLEAGRGGRARTYDNRFWRPVLYQLSYTPTESGVAARPRRLKHREHPDCKSEATAGFGFLA